MSESAPLLGQKTHHGLQGRRLTLALVGMGLVVFICGLDNSIVSTALPSIASDLSATPSQYSWVGTSFLLSQTIVTPINGRLTDIIGRKPVVYGAIICIAVFSALSGAAKDINSLIVARALTGIGGGSMVGLSPIVISDIAPWKDRGKAQSYMALAGSLSGALGPFIGGWLANTVSCATLELQPPSNDTTKLRASFDYLGLGLVTSGAAFAVVGFANAADNGFSARSAYLPIAIGGLLVVFAILHILTTSKNAVIPKQLLTHRTPLFFLIGTLCQSLMFVPVTFLLPQFFQGVKGSDPEESGIQMIPFSIGIAAFGFITGQLCSHLTDVRLLVWTGYSTQLVAYTLFSLLLTPHVHVYVQSVIIGLTAAGIGLAISPTMLVIQASVPHEDMAAATSGWVLVRSMGPSTGLAMFSALLNTQLHSRFTPIPGYGTDFTIPVGQADYNAIHALPEPLKGTVLGAFSDSFRTCWITGAALMLFALVISVQTSRHELELESTAGGGTGTVPDPEVAGIAEASSERGRG